MQANMDASQHHELDMLTTRNAQLGGVDDSNLPAFPSAPPVGSEAPYAAPNFLVMNTCECDSYWAYLHDGAMG